MRAVLILFNSLKESKQLYSPKCQTSLFNLSFFFFMSTESAAVQIVLQNKFSVFSRLYLLLSSDRSRCIICLQKEENNNKMLNKFLCVFFKERSCFSLRLAFLCNKYTQSPACYEVATRNKTVLILLYKSSLNPGHQDRQSRSNHSARSSPWSPVTV